MADDLVRHRCSPLELSNVSRDTLIAKMLRLIRFLGLSACLSASASVTANICLAIIRLLEIIKLRIHRKRDAVN